MDEKATTIESVHSCDLDSKLRRPSNANHWPGYAGRLLVIIL